MGGISIGQDITERAGTLKALKITQAQVMAILSAADDAMVAVNHLGRIVLWSHSAARLFGWREEEILGKDPEVLMPNEIRAEHRERLHHFFESVKTGSYPGRIFTTTAVSRSGIILPVRITLTLAEIDGKPMVFAAIRDLADRKRMEKILLQSEKTKELGEMAAGIAHDFNNTLAAILASAQLCKKNTRDTLLLELIENISKSASQGAKKIATLLPATGNDPGGQQGFTSAQLDRLVEEALEFTSFRWKDQTQNHGHTIIVSTDFAPTPSILVIPADFREMLTNILFNAVDALPRGGKIHITSRIVGHEVVLVCEDDGDGITPEAQERVFEPFFTTKGVGHAGLGLTIARSIATRHSGRLTLRSTKGVGTAVTLHLPLTTTAALPESLRLAAFMTSHYRILVIDDEALVREALFRMLQAAGHEVVGAADGKEGVRLFREEQFDLVITDLGMPVMGGIDAATRIKRLKPDTPVIVITGWGVAAEHVRQKMGSADAIIAKPFDIDVVLETVARLAASRAVG